MFRAPVLCFLGALFLFAGSSSAQKSAFDKPTLEAYVRHLYNLNAALTVQVGDPKPSDLPGFSEVRVRISQGTASQELPLLISKDGKKIVQGTYYDVNNNPFKSELAKLK